MKSDREKLAELVCGAINDDCSGHCNLSTEINCLQCAKIADHLIANDVTINVPLKPIERKVDADNIIIGNVRWCKGTTIYECPKCGCFVSKVYDYCHKCGQKFDRKEPKP